MELLARPVWLLVPLPQICATFSRHLVLVSLSSWWVHGIEPDENVAPKDAHNPSRPHVALNSLSAVELTSVGHCPVASPPDDASLVFSLYRHCLCLEFGLFDYLRTELYGGFGKSCKFS